MKNILFTLILFLGSIAAFADGGRNYSIDPQSIYNVNFKQKYTVKARYTVEGNTMLFIPKAEDFKFDKFIDTTGYVKNVTSNGATLYVEFYHRDTAAAISGTVKLCFNAKANDEATTMSWYSLPLQYSYPVMTKVDPGEIAGPSELYEQGEKPSSIKSVYEAIPLNGPITYSWEKKRGSGSWETIEGASSEILYPDAIGTMSDYYRRKATDGAGNSAYSNTVEIIPMLTAGEIGISYTDTGNILTLTNVVSPNSTGATISWQSSVDLLFWADLQGSTKSITVTKPSKTTYYRRKITTLANDTYGDPIVAYSNYACYSTETPEAISTMSYWHADSAVTDIDYYDGLGRKFQTVAAQATMDGKDIVTAYRYDNKGRESGVTVPFCKNGSGEFAHNAGYKNRIYHGDGKAATSTVYDNSPLDRIVRTYKPGEAYQSQGEGHYTATAYGVNSSNEVMRLELDGNGFTVSGHHTAATLHKTVTTDEDGSQLEFFTDARGNNILERRKAGNNIYADTYYVYDAKNRPKVVVSPQGSTKLTNGTAYSDTCSLVRELCYIYSYDDEDRIVMKRLPGRSYEYFSYDTNGRLAAYLDDAMMTEGITKLFSYDALGREKGFRYATGKSECCQQWNHYDDYTHSNVAAFYPVSGVVAQSDLAASAKGMLTYDRTFELYGNWASEVRERTYWYDSRGRCVQTYTAYPVGINCRTSVKYDYAGNPLTTVEQYTYGSSTLTITTGCTFDRRGRKLTEQTTVDGTALSSAVFTYDEQGRVTRTLLNGNIDITTSYNLQGWMTALQAAKVNGNGVINTVLFDEILRYYDTTDSLATPLYAGKIAQIDWKRKMQIDGNDRFLYSYDPLGRLTKAEHRITELNGNSTKGSHTEQATYDRNSNILSLNAKKGIINKWQKDYTLNGNRIATVTKNFINEYTAEYDSRGNLTRIPWENLQIAYNLINLPRSITAADGTKIDYSYLSDGTKFRAVSETGVNHLYTGSLRWKLQGGTITPESFAIAGGRATLEANGWTAHYYITDHLGSTRAVANTSGNAFATFDYTPYGSLLNAEDTPTGTDYLFTGKENQAKQGAGELYDSQARFMDTGGRFLSIDPMAEKFYHLSPYAYCAGDPVNLVDPDGELPDFFWDIYSIASGIYSAAKNTIKGEFKEALKDAAGVGLDVVSAVIPGVPAIGRVLRNGDNLVDAAKVLNKADNVVDAGRVENKAEDVVDAGKATTRIEKLHEKAKIGQEAHRQIEAKLKKESGAEIEQVIKIGKNKVRKDAIMPDGTLVIIKPNTPSGHKAAQKRGNLMRGYGYKTQTIFYDPNDPTYLPGSRTYIGPK